MSEMPDAEIWTAGFVYVEGARQYFCYDIKIKDGRPQEKYHHDRIVQAKDARIAELEAQLKEREGWVMVPMPDSACLHSGCHGLSGDRLSGHRFD